MQAIDLADFPKLDEHELKLFFTGSYQLSQAISYLGELMGEDETPQLYFVIAAPTILKMEIQSRHKNRKTYRCYVDYVPNGNKCTDICRYTCDCPNGLRTVGCCSHVASIVYYLSHARYVSRVVKPAAILSKVFESNPVPVVINSDSDQD